MRSEQKWTVRVERQPHRDAVRRLRQAYALLWRVSPLTSTTAEPDTGDKKAPSCIQEVQT